MSETDEEQNNHK